jgi:uncharacterized protein YggU (UPF0235/DUF167 family)
LGNLNVSIVELLLIFELILLVAAGFFWGVSLLIAPKTADDELSVFWRTFWKVFLRRRVKFKVALANLEHGKAREYEKMKQHGDVDGIKDLLREELDEHEVDDAELARLLEGDADERAMAGSVAGIETADAPASVAAMRARASQLNVKVVPFSDADAIVSIDRDGATVNVVSAPEDGRSNKAVIDLLAKAFGIKPYQISLIKGHYRAKKLVQIAGLDAGQLEQKVSAISSQVAR